MECPKIVGMSFEKFSGHLAGKHWQSKLVHVQYEEWTEGKIRARHEYFDNLDGILGAINDDYFILNTSPLRSKITKVTVLSVDLSFFQTKFTQDISKHQFVEMVTESGHIFTLEKTTDYILLQSSLSRLFGSTASRHFRDGVRRKKLETLEQICVDCNLNCRRTVQ